MTKEQLKRAKEIESTINIIKDTMLLQDTEIRPSAIKFNFVYTNIERRPFGSEFIESSDAKITQAGLKVWLEEEIVNIGERLRSKMQKKVKQLEQELEQL